ncbi:MAG: epimerase, partial [bacterium]
GSGQAATGGEPVEVVARLTRRRLVPRWGAYPTAAHDHERYVADTGRARALLGWSPRTSLVDGLAATIRSMRDG